MYQISNTWLTHYTLQSLTSLVCRSAIAATQFPVKTQGSRLAYILSVDEFTAAGC